MFFLGLLLPICYIAGYTGISIPTQWAVLLVYLGTVFWWQGGKLHWAAIGFLGYAALSLLWSPDYGFGVMIAVVWVVSFWYGSTLDDLTELWQGLAIGMTVNSGVAIAQWLGYRPVLSEGIGGLLFSPVLLGACAALVIVALVCNRMWWFIPGLLPALWLSHSRGAWVVLGLSLVARYLGWVIPVVLLVIAGAVALVIQLNPSDFVRLQFWAVAIHGMTIFGNGAGAFNSIYLDHIGYLTHAENVHNDYLQLVYEYGIFSIIPLAWWATGLTHIRSRYWTVLFAFSVLSLFYFPLYSPIPTFIGCIVAGHILRIDVAMRAVRDDWRSYFLARPEKWGSVPRAAGLVDIPDFPRTPIPHH